MKYMKILVTGNMGYVGPGVVRHLRIAQPDWDLIGFDMGYFAHCLTASEPLPESLLDAQYFGDVRAFPGELLRGVDGIVHLAAISNDPMGMQYERVTAEINHEASVVLAQKAKAAGVGTFVFASSCSVYGCADEGARNEQSAVNPLTAYARSKVMTEHDLQPLADGKFKVTCLRFATACGMSPRLRLDLVLNDFVAAAMAERKITILSDGSPWRPLINVNDMARACEWGLIRPSGVGGDFLVVNAGSDDWNYRVRELAKAVAEVIPGVDVSINKNAPPDKRSYRVDFSLFGRLAPDHQPQRDVVSTIRGLQQGLEAMQFHDRDFRNSGLMRLRVLSGLRNREILTERLTWTRTRAAADAQFSALRAARAPS